MSVKPLRAALAAAAFALSLGSAASAQAPTLSTDPGLAPAGVYELDETHARVTFTLSHLGLSQYTAWMSEVEGKLTFDPAAPEKSSLEASVAAASVHTLLPDFDKKLAGPAILDAERNPTITFKSTSIERTGPTTGRVTGDLTMRGVTKPVTLDVTFNGGLVNPFSQAYTLGFSATGTIKRSEWGLTEYVAFGIGDDVTLRIEAEFAAAKAAEER